MSKRELGRVEVLARVRGKQLGVVDAARLMRVSYRQAKRLWKRYREEGAAGLKHRSAETNELHPTQTKTQKEHISNEVSMGTFLKSFDRKGKRVLTYSYMGM
jgi:dUTPase